MKKLISNECKNRKEKTTFKVTEASILVAQNTRPDAFNKNTGLTFDSLEDLHNHFKSNKNCFKAVVYRVLKLEETIDNWQRKTNLGIFQVGDTTKQEYDEMIDLIA